jgi:hypothetical protein
MNVMFEVLEEVDALAAADGLNACRLTAAPTPPTAGENDISSDGPIPPKRVLVGCVATELSCNVTVVFAVRVPAGIVTLSPPGREIVPPTEATIGMLALAIVPAMRTKNEPDFVESIELVAETVTIYAAGAVVGA